MTGNESAPAPADTPRPGLAEPGPAEPDGPEPASAEPDGAEPDGSETDAEAPAPLEVDGIEPDPDGTPMFSVRTRPTWRGVWRLVAFAILLVASVGFIMGGVIRSTGMGSVLFVFLGVAGILMFGAGLLMSLGVMLARRPVLELTAEGVRRPARWPLPRRTDRTLPWARLTALTALRRGVSGASGGEHDYLVFLPTAGLAELARTAGRPALVAFTLRDVKATAEAVPWCFEVAPDWDATLPQIVKQVRRRNAVPVIDRRTR